MVCIANEHVAPHGRTKSNSQQLDMTQYKLLASKLLQQQQQHSVFV